MRERTLRRWRAYEILIGGQALTRLTFMILDELPAWTLSPNLQLCDFKRWSKISIKIQKKHTPDRRGKAWRRLAKLLAASASFWIF